MDAIMPAVATFMPEAHEMMMADPDLMSAEAIVARFCGADQPDRAFIDLVIPHHESAIAASRSALTEAEHPELRTFAQDVITAQQAEVDTMTQIRAEISG